MDDDQPSLLRRVIAIAVLVVVAAIALRLVVGFVAGLLSALLWILTVVALVVAFFWARAQLNKPRGRKRDRTVEGPGRTRAVNAAPAEDPVAAEMRKITEQLRDQGRM
jgi:beta-lactamase regulating signal transducer with metallopeptidase domain